MWMKWFFNFPLKLPTRNKICMRKKIWENIKMSKNMISRSRHLGFSFLPHQSIVREKVRYATKFVLSYISLDQLRCQCLNLIVLLNTTFIVMFKNHHWGNWDWSIGAPMMMYVYLRCWGDKYFEHIINQWIISIKIIQNLY